MGYLSISCDFFYIVVIYDLIGPLSYGIYRLLLFSFFLKFFLKSTLAYLNGIYRIHSVRHLLEITVLGQHDFSGFFSRNAYRIHHSLQKISTTITFCIRLNNYVL